MKIKVLKPFATDKLTDQEKVFGYLMTHYLEKYGFDYEFTISNQDLKILLYGKLEGHIIHRTLPKEITKIVKFAIYSDYRSGIRLTKSAYNSGVNRYDENGNQYKILGKEWVTIKDPKAIVIYSYLMGALAHTSHDTYEGEDQFGHTKIDLEYEMEESYAQANRLQRMVNPLEFTQLLQIAQLDK